MVSKTQLSDQFELVGEELELQEAEEIRWRGFDLIDQSPQGDKDTVISVNLAQLKNANSVTIAVLLAWYRRATLHNKSIVFTELSPELCDIIDFSGLTSILLNEN